MIELGKVPPQNIELEEAILGACMLESRAFEEIQDILSENSFYRTEHQKIFRSIYQLFNDNKAIDILTVIEKLRQSNELENVGGPAFLTKLTDRIASSAHIEFHARIIQQKYIQRELIRISTEIQHKAYDDSIEDISELIDFSEQQISGITINSINKIGLKMGEIGKRRLKILDEISKGEIKLSGVPCWEKLNKTIGAWQPSNLIIIAARPAMGKTRLSQEIAKIAAENGCPVAFFSLEMEDTELYDRQLASETGLENMTIRQANFKNEDWEKIENAQRKIENLELIIDDTPALTINEFKSKARYYKRKNDIKLIIVDYLQLMRSPDHSKNREREISHISQSLKLIAKELNIPVIALSQLSRKVEERADKTPVLSDLRESGAIEQDADVVAFIHRPEVYEKEVSEENKNKIEFIFAKHRHGATGIITLYRSDKWSTIYEYKGQFDQDKINELEF